MIDNDINTILEKVKAEISEYLIKIKNDYKTNIVVPKTMHELCNCLSFLKKKKNKNRFHR